ncbi:MAG: acyltransferase family protein [Treponema sp.]|nr:acyltransferase family protein [Treponema sp.]
MQNEINTKRIEWIDTAKFIGIFLMITGHVMEEINMRVLLYHYIYSFHMPLFFILSGITFSSNKPLKVSIKNFFVQLIIPYIFFYCLDYIFWFFVSFLRHPEIFERNLYDGFIKPFIGLFTGYNSSYSTDVGKSIWFFVVLFTCKGISRLFDEIKYKFKFLELIFSLITIVFSYILFYTKIDLPLYIPETLMSYSFFYIGKVVKNKINFEKKYQYCLLFVITLVLQMIGSYLQKGVGIRGVNMGHNYFGMLFYPLAILGCFSIEMLCNILPKLKGGLKFLSVNTITIVGFNRFLITLVRGIIKFFICNGSNILINYSYIFIVTINVLIFSFIPCYIMQKYFPFIIGKKK